MAAVGPVAEELVAVAATQVVGDLGGEVVHELVDAAGAADAAEVAVEVAHVTGDETDFEVSSCSRSAGLGPAGLVGPVEQAVAGLTGPVGPAAA